MSAEQLELKEGQEVTITIPFHYTIGETGYHSGKLLSTIEDCKNEVLAELGAGELNEDNVNLEATY